MLNRLKLWVCQIRAVDKEGSVCNQRFWTERGRTRHWQAAHTGLEIVCHAAGEAVEGHPHG